MLTACIPTFHQVYESQNKTRAIFLQVGILIYDFVMQNRRTLKNTESPLNHTVRYYLFFLHEKIHEGLEGTLNQLH